MQLNKYLKKIFKLALLSPFQSIIIQEDLISHSIAEAFKFFNMISNLRLHVFYRLRFLETAFKKSH